MEEDHESRLSHIHRLHVRQVWRTLRYLGVRDPDLADASQEVFFVAHRKLAEFRGDSSLRTWLHAISLRVASEYRRRVRTRCEVPLEELAEAPEVPEQQPEVEREEARSALIALLNELDSPRREVLVLYEIEELTMKEIVELLGIPLQTGYSRLHSARDWLAARMEAHR